jgi:hypothetical protein
MQKVWKKTLVLQKSTLILQNESRFLGIWAKWTRWRRFSVCLFDVMKVSVMYRGLRILVWFLMSFDAS